MLKGNNGLKEITSYKGYGMKDHVQVTCPLPIGKFTTCI